MEKQLKDFIHLYLGCECKMTKPSYHAVHELRLSADTAFALTGKLLHYFIEPTTKAEVKPILRKLDSITDDEIRGLIGYDKLKENYSSVSYRKEKRHIMIGYSIDAGEEGTYPMSHKVDFNRLEPFYFHYLLSKHFDLFNLIESGFAIDADTIKQ